MRKTEQTDLHRFLDDSDEEQDPQSEYDDDITMNGGAKHPHNKVSEVC